MQLEARAAVRHENQEPTSPALGAFRGVMDAPMLRPRRIYVRARVCAWLRRRWSALCPLVSGRVGRVGIAS